MPPLKSPNLTSSRNSELTIASKTSQEPKYSREALQAALPLLPREIIERLLLDIAVKHTEFDPNSRLADCIISRAAAVRETRRSNQNPMPQAVQPQQLRTYEYGTGNPPPAGIVLKEPAIIRAPKRPSDGATKPPAKRTKARKPLDFDKLEDRAWVLMNKTPGVFAGAVKVEDGMEKIIEKIAAEVSTVNDLTIKQTALLYLGKIVYQVYNAEPSKKAKEVRNGTAPPALNRAMMEILTGMSVGERIEFITSEAGRDWETQVKIPLGYGGFWTGPQVEELMDLFPGYGEDEASSGGEGNQD